MISKDKKDTILREIVKPNLKKAGYSLTGQTYYSMRKDCCLAIRLQSSQFNSTVTGYSFWFHIKTLPCDVSQETLKSGCFGCFERLEINEGVLLPDCGYLHPYRSSLGYRIDGCKSYEPQDMDVEDIKNRINDDLCLYILPPLAAINTLADWDLQALEWEKMLISNRSLLLRFYSMTQEGVADQNNIPHLIDVRRRFHLSAGEIVENYLLYQQVKAFSAWPDEDKWDFILEVLAEENLSF